jgi:hypothetical protein
MALKTVVPTLSRDNPFRGGLSVRWIGRASFDDGRTTDMETPVLSLNVELATGLGKRG